MDQVFKALADASRRQLLDRLHARNGQTLGELCEHLDMTRQAVTKHLVILERANLVVAVRRGREKLHYLNPVPIHDIAERWIGKYERHRLVALSDSSKGWKKMMNEPTFVPKTVYVTYIAAAAETVWTALTDPEFTKAILLRPHGRDRAEGRGQLHPAHAGWTDRRAGQGDRMGSAAPPRRDLVRRMDRGDAQAARMPGDLPDRRARRGRAPDHERGAPVGRARRDSGRRSHGLAADPVEPQEPVGDRQADRRQGRAAEGDAGGVKRHAG